MKIMKKLEKINNNSNLPITLVVKTLGPVVRKKHLRKKLNGYTCIMCEKYYKTKNLNEEDYKNLLNKCSKHRAKWSPYKTPPHFWDTDFPENNKNISKENSK